jgi:hypothetical protein
MSKNIYYPRNDRIQDQLNTLISQNERMMLLMEDLINGVHRVEKQLEKLTDEPIDDDEREIC